MHYNDVEKTEKFNRKQFSSSVYDHSNQPKRLKVNQMNVRYRFCHFVAFIEFI